MAASASSSSWSDLLPEDLLGRVLAELPFPADRARFRAVCRAWHSAARHHARQLPWIVLPDGSFCTVGDGGAFFTAGIPGLPAESNVTCLGAAADGWLALDRTDDEFRRTNFRDKLLLDECRFLQPRADVKHAHTYLLHNPFSGETVPLPELDAIVGDVAETFEIRKVLMRSSSTSPPPEDDLVAVTTNNCNYNIILCRPGKGSCVVEEYLRVIDVVFHHGDDDNNKLYGITPEEELVAFDLAEDDQGKPTVNKFRRVIRQPLADGEEDEWSWMYDDDDDDDHYSDRNNDDDDDDNNNISSDEEEEDKGGGHDDDSEAAEEQEDLDGDGQVPNGVVIVEDKEVPYEPKDYIKTTRRLVQSSCGLLMVRHHVQSPPFLPGEYTRGVDIFKADIKAGKWVPLNALAHGEALFLSRSFCKSTRAYGDIKDGCIYSGYGRCI